MTMTGESSTQPRTYPAGVTSWVDTEQPDVAAALDFYGGSFGWSFADAMPPEAPGRYVIAQLGGRDVAAIGSADPDRADRKVAWNTYIATDDVNAATTRLTDLGAMVVTPPVDAGPGGRTATFRDPEGAEFRLWQARRRLGAQLTNAPGSWNFSDLHTGDADCARRFYGSAFGWVFVDLGYGTAVQVPGYGDHLESTIDPEIRTRQADAPAGFEDVIGGIAQLDADEVPHWRVTFTVADRDQAAARAEQLGGEVLGQQDSLWTKTATIGDPQGAVFTASQFTPPTSWEG
jgi:predicted enzyme related to lactoylglutathione lyase